MRNKDPLLTFANRENITYIFVDEQVRSWGGLDTTNRPYLHMIYQNEDVQIYKVAQN